jgi:hypothetical protein
MRPIKSLLVLVFARAFGNAVSAVRPWDRGWELPNKCLEARAVARPIIGKEGAYSFYARRISFESDCFYGMWTWIYEYTPPPPPPIIVSSYRPLLEASIPNLYFKDHVKSVLRICSAQAYIPMVRTNTAEKRLRMHQIMKIWRGIWISISKTKTCLLIGQKLVKRMRKYSKWVD